MLKLTIEKEINLETITLQPGDIVDGIQRSSDTYTIFIRNGWWTIPIEYFIKEDN